MISSIHLKGKNMADRKGFEPSKACTLHAFQACSFNHSDTCLNKICYQNLAHFAKFDKIFCSFWAKFSKNFCKISQNFSKIRYNFDLFL